MMTTQSSARDPKAINEEEYPNDISTPRTKKSTARGAGRRLAQLKILDAETRLGRKERLSCAFFRPRTASCAIVRITA